MLGIGLLSLALVAGFVRYRQPIELQNEFMNAINTGQSVRARQILDSGVDPTKLPDQADLLICAVIYCDPATVQALINKGVNVNGKTEKAEHEFTALHCAVIHRRSDMVDVLLRNGANVRAKMTDGYTPLMQMSRKAHPYAQTGEDQTIIRLLKRAEQKSAKTD